MQTENRCDIVDLIIGYSSRSGARINRADALGMLLLSLLDKLPEEGKYFGLVLCNPFKTLKLREYQSMGNQNVRADCSESKIMRKNAVRCFTIALRVSSQSGLSRGWMLRCSSGTKSSSSV